MIRPAQLKRLEAALRAENKAKESGTPVELSRCTAVALAAIRASTREELRALEADLQKRLGDDR